MRSSYPKVTKITIRPDSPTGGSMQQRGANLDAVGFNFRFILERRPNLAVELYRLYREASGIKAGDARAPEEDFRTAVAEMERLTGLPIV